MAYRLDAIACVNCKHWQPASPRDDMGDCRRNAPVLLQPDPRFGALAQSATRWPRTSRTERCGEHVVARLETIRERKGEAKP